MNERDARDGEPAHGASAHREPAQGASTHREPAHGASAHREPARIASTPIEPAHVLVTGAAGAIGAAIARELRRMWPRTRLALLDRDAQAMEPLARELGNASTHAADLRDIASLPDVVARIEAQAAQSTRSDAQAAQGTRSDAQAAHSARSEAQATQAALGTRIEAQAAQTVRSDARADARARVRTDRDPDAAAGARGVAAAGLREDASADAGRLPLDGLVNCAGVMWVRHVATWDWADADALLAVDLLAPLRLQDVIAHGLVARGARGVIVNIASMAGKVPLRGCAYYGAAKAGLGMASEIARADLAPHGIRVVTVYPGPVRSALEQGARDAYGGGGLFGRYAPTGEPAELARRVAQAIAEDEPRVIYPRLYGVGWTAPNLASWFALAYGPPPIR